jgi:uncharacterized membrane protein
MRTDVVFVVLGMALVTYATRAGGLWLMARVKPSPRLEAGLRQMPGAVLAALIAPLAWSGGTAERLALVATAIVAARTRSILLSLATGVASVWMLRMLNV